MTFDNHMYQIIRHIVSAHPNLVPHLISLASTQETWKKFLEQQDKWLAQGGSISKLHPILHDFDSDNKVADLQYFAQDLFVASLVNKHNPSRHVDIGSRIDGFVAHVASFREIYVFDARPFKHHYPNILFQQADLRSIPENLYNFSDSISSLHAIEHFGLGRYGEPLDPNGHIKGFNSMLTMLLKGGRLYISFPIGEKTEVHFNAHRIFHPLDVFGWADPCHSIALERFDYIDEEGRLHEMFDLRRTLPSVKYSAGIYTFRKI